MRTSTLCSLPLIAVLVACGGGESQSKTPATDVPVPPETSPPAAPSAGFGGAKPGSATPWGADVADAGAPKK